MHSTDLGQALVCETGPTSLVNAAAPAPQDLGDNVRIASDLHDILVNQIFIVSLDLHAALTLTGDAQATARITRAIRGLDHAITDLRGTLFDLARHAAPADHEHHGSIPDSTT